MQRLYDEDFYAWTQAQARELQRKTPDKAAAKRATQRAGAAEGYTAIADAFKRAKAQPAAKAARPNAARYRCPDTGSTWSGRGLRPAWLRAKLAAGAHLADFDTQASPTPASAAAQSSISAIPGFFSSSSLRNACTKPTICSASRSSSAGHRLARIAVSVRRSG